MVGLHGGALSTLRDPSWGGQLSEHPFGFLNDLQLVECGQVSEHLGVQVSERSFSGVCNTAVYLPEKFVYLIGFEVRKPEFTFVNLQT